MYQTLLFEVRKPGIGLLTMNRPDVLNALSIQTFQELNALFDRLEQHSEVRGLIVTGAGRSFVAGADIGEMRDLTSIEGKKFGVHGGSVFLKLENMPKPVIAAVNGFALGGGN